MIDISYIVTACQRPDFLACCLFSLRCQTHAQFEVIVTNNGQTDAHRQASRDVLQVLGDARFRLLEGSWRHCYYASEDAALLASGRYLCFPSDDSYYVPFFAEKMLAAGSAARAQIVLCEQVYSRWEQPHYTILPVAAAVDHVDKTGFLINRTWFAGFPDKEGGVTSDGQMIEDAVRRGAKVAKVDEVLCVHN